MATTPRWIGGAPTITGLRRRRDDRAVQWGRNTRPDQRSVLQIGSNHQGPNNPMAAIDRLVHHSMILEFDGKSVRAKKDKARIT